MFGRTDLRISLSGAKFDANEDFDVRSAMAPPKLRQISEKTNFRSKIFTKKQFRRRKTKRPKLIETRSGKVSRRSEPSLTGKRPLAYMQMLRHDVKGLRGPTVHSMLSSMMR